jgi:hypothetical protein
MQTYRRIIWHCLVCRDKGAVEGHVVRNEENWPFAVSVSMCLYFVEDVFEGAYLP